MRDAKGKEKDRERKRMHEGMEEVSGKRENEEEKG